MSSLTILALAFALAFLALGSIVSHGAPGVVDTAVHDALRGHAVALAVPLTQLGRFPAYAALCAVSLAFGIVRRAWFRRALIAVVVLAGAWKVSDLFKDQFMRARPPGQLVFHESTFSYASGHATLALTFYGAWAFYAWRSDLGRPLRRTLVAAAALVILAIGWSRLALGAHFFTDVVGGYLLGAAFLCILAAATRSVAPEKQTNRSSGDNGGG
jgi:undecaprenyl-diphosphatase